MESFDKEWIESTRDEIIRLSPSLNKDSIEKMLWSYCFEDVDGKDELRQDVESILGVYSPNLLFSKRPVLAPPDLDRLQDIRIGRVVVGDRETFDFSLHKNDFTRHVAIYAQTGHGKTSLLYCLMDQFLEKKIPFLYIDLKKDGRALLRQSKELIVIPWREIKWNPLRNPPGMEVKIWWQLFAEVCGHNWGVYHAGVNYLLEYLDELYEGYDKTKHYPTLHDLYELMISKEETSKKRLEYFDVMYNRVRTLVSVLGDTINCEEGLPIEEILNFPVVLELDRLRAEEQNWIVEVILAFIYAYRLVQGHRSEQLRHVIITDEAHRIWDANKEYRETTKEMGTPTITVFPTQFRDFGESLILTSQMPSAIMDSIHANTLVKIVGNLGSGKDIFAISEAMNLNEEERNAISELQRGEWIVKLSDRYTKPFMIVSDNKQVDKDVRDEEVSERAKSFLSRFNKSKPEAKAPIQEDKQEQKLPFLSEDARNLLIDINNSQFKSLTNRYKTLGLLGKRGDNAKQELIQKNLVKEVSVTLGNFRPIKYLVPSSTGLELLRKIGQDTKAWEYIGHVGFEHRLYQVLITHYHRKIGHQSSLEKAIGDSRVDVFVQEGDKRIGIEVELDSDIKPWKFLKLQKELDGLIIICKDLATLKNIEQAISEVAYTSVAGKIHFYTITDYLSMLRNIAYGNVEKKSNNSEKAISSSSSNKKQEKKVDKQIE